VVEVLVKVLESLTTLEGLSVVLEATLPPDVGVDACEVAPGDEVEKVRDEF
jgi:hypothetical protein